MQTIASCANHRACFYEHEYPADTAAGFVAEGLRAGNGCVAILLHKHLAAVEQRLVAAGNALQIKNVTTIAFELPISCITTATEPVIGVWSTASMPTNRTGSNSATATSMTQISRLGKPLTNELIIGLPDKDKFNMSEPKDDAQFLNYVTNPTLPTLLELLFSSAGVTAPTVFPRADFIAVFLTGVTGVNKPANVVPSEMMRLNTALPRARCRCASIRLRAMARFRSSSTTTAADG